MTWLDFIASIVNSLAWPIAIVIVAAIFRSQIADVLSRLRSFSHGKSTFSFDEKIAQLEEESPPLEPPSPAHSIELQTFSDIAYSYPHLAVLEAWRTVELELQRLAGTTDNRQRSTGYVISALHKSGLVDGKLYKELLQMRELRNIAAHRPNGMISPHSALSFADRALFVTKKLESIPELNTTHG